MENRPTQTLPSDLDHEALRELFLNAPESDATRILAIVVSLVLLVTVLWLVRRRGLREELTPIWVITAAGIFLVGLQPDLLHGVTRLIGAWTASSTVFLLTSLFLMAICLSYAVRLSRASVQIKNLAQQTALLRGRLDRLERTNTDHGRRSADSR